MEQPKNNRQLLPIVLISLILLAFVAKLQLHYLQFMPKNIVNYYHTNLEIPKSHFTSIIIKKPSQINGLNKVNTWQVMTNNYFKNFKLFEMQHCGCIRKVPNVPNTNIKPILYNQTTCSIEAFHRIVEACP